MAEPLEAGSGRRNISDNGLTSTACFLPACLAFPGVRRKSVETPTLAIPIWAGHPQRQQPLAWENGQHRVESFGASICTMSYVSLFFACFLSQFLSFIIAIKGQQRTLRIQLRPVSVPESPLSRWLRPEPTTIRQTMRQRVQLRASLYGTRSQQSVLFSSCVALLIMNGPHPPPYIILLCPSQFNHPPHKWDKLCHSGSLVADDRRLGGLWDMEVRRARTFPGG